MERKKETKKQRNKERKKEKKDRWTFSEGFIANKRTENLRI